MNPEWPIFGFETDFAGSLRCIPMSVRLKLDHCGVKLSLKQWNRFPHEDRERLVMQACDTPEDVQSFKRSVVQLIEVRAQSKAEEVPIDANPEWSDPGRVPTQIVDYAVNLGVIPPSVKQWAALTPLQRFAMFKLTRPGHDNDNFIPAMREFGVLNS